MGTWNPYPRVTSSLDYWQEAMFVNPKINKEEGEKIDSGGRDGVQQRPSFQSRAGQGTSKWELEEERTWQSPGTLALISGLLKFTPIVSKGQ